ncbi:MAG: hypothetical protein LBD89_05050 [Tannerellaceae bacterium]|jgi:hypothetical protein|nr:hypothetical protein [Tannerellaceae bacterium]
MMNTTKSFKNLRGSLLTGVTAMSMLLAPNFRADGAQSAPAIGGILQQTDLDPLLRGEWLLEAVEFKIGNAPAQRLQVEALVNNPAVRALVGSFIDDRYYSILFYGNEVGVDLRNLTNNSNRPLKGTYSVANSQLTISLREEQSHTFDYRVEGEELSISYVLGSSRLSLIFKLFIKY